MWSTLFFESCTIVLSIDWASYLFIAKSQYSWKVMNSPYSWIRSWSHNIMQVHRGVTWQLMTSSAGRALKRRSTVSVVSMGSSWRTCTTHLTSTEAWVQRSRPVWPAWQVKWDGWCLDWLLGYRCCQVSSEQRVDTPGPLVPTARAWMISLTICATKCGKLQKKTTSFCLLRMVHKSRELVLFYDQYQHMKHECWM